MANNVSIVTPCWRCLSQQTHVVCSTFEDRKFWKGRVQDMTHKRGWKERKARPQGLDSLTPHGPQSCTGPHPISAAAQVPVHRNSGARAPTNRARPPCAQPEWHQETRLWAARIGCGFPALGNGENAAVSSAMCPHGEPHSPCLAAAQVESGAVPAVETIRSQSCDVCCFRIFQGSVCVWRKDF